MNELKTLQKCQILLTCGVLTGVWSNLFVNIKKDNNGKIVNPFKIN